MNDPLFMSVKEVIAAMQDAGIRIYTNLFNDLYDSGRAPFAHLLRTGPSGRRSYLIYRSEFNEWLEALTGKEVQPQ